MITENYFRSISGLPPALYPQCQLSQSALEQWYPNLITTAIFCGNGKHSTEYCRARKKADQEA